MTVPRKIAFIATDGVEEVELVKPWDAVEEAGYEPVLIAPHEGEIQSFHDTDKSQMYHVDAVTDNASPDAFTSLVLPGGVINGDSLRGDKTVISFIREFNKQEKPIAAICHSHWLMIEAGVVEGKRVTSWPSIQTDLRNAGALWQNVCMSSDGNLITSRNTNDLPAFCLALLEAINEEVIEFSSSYR